MGRREPFKLTSIASLAYAYPVLRILQTLSLCEYIVN